MAEINNLKELEERGCLELGDIVNFTVNKEIIGYKVKTLSHRAYLCSNGNTGSNCVIFEVLELDKFKMAERVYGYKPVNSYDTTKVWPETRKEDYLALTRLVKELYKIIEEKEIKYTKYNRFEIMDI